MASTGGHAGFRGCLICHSKCWADIVSLYSHKLTLFWSYSWHTSYSGLFDSPVNHSTHYWSWFIYVFIPQRLRQSNPNSWTLLFFALAFTPPCQSKVMSAVIASRLQTATRFTEEVNRRDCDGSRWAGKTSASQIHTHIFPLLKQCRLGLFTLWGVLHQQGSRCSWWRPSFSPLVFGKNVLQSQ